MTVQQRILALKLLQHLAENPAYGERLGAAVELRKKTEEEEHV